ncbi:MAG: ketopantoate reductase family protein [Candidatus Thorarchaeota archaeon]
MEKLKSVVYGAGAIGSVLGATLHRAGRGVTLVARPSHVKAIDESGLSVFGVDEYVVNVPASSDPSVVKGAGLVFLTVKTQDTKSAVEEFSPYLEDSAYVVSLQNGVRNPEIIASIIGEERTVPGVVRFMASYLKPGEVEYTWKGNCIIGEMDGAVTDRIKRISEYVFPAVETRTSTNIEGEMWTKLILNLINIPLALTGMSFPFGFRDEHLRLITESAWSEGYAVVKAAGIKADFQDLDTWLGILKDEARRNAWMSQLSPDIRVHPSTHQALVRGSTDESDYLTGEIIRLGAQIGTETPVNALLMQKIEEVLQSGSIEYVESEDLWREIEAAKST